MPWPIIAAAGGSLIGGLIGNRARRIEAEKDRNFQERMSSTSWQRGITDMEKAGVNPALAYAKGGASTPGGAMAGQQDPAEGVVSSAMQAKRLGEDMKLVRQQVKQSWAAAEKDKAQARLAQTAGFRNIQLEKNDEIQGRILGLQLPWMQASAKAIGRFPQAAMMQLLLNSGGSQLMGVAGGLGMANVVRRTSKVRIGKGN